ncbi:hypothetical protein DPMN_083126 [Dreissena polymorpha]|uniref:Uncharacterized protein n=1 Tax=Dreissena polymorpha TaxID=45954 RepID=A0A9D3Y860_DREPO|nr:hypothetical protein DPMN_083126 [Dreissena polymorpha]
MENYSNETYALTKVHEDWDKNATSRGNITERRSDRLSSGSYGAKSKSDVMRNAKLLKGSGIFLNEDLTKLNAEVLASVRHKDPETVERAWSFDGKLYARFRGKERSEIIDYEHFPTWLNKPWPKAHKSTPYGPIDRCHGVVFLVVVIVI